MQPSVVIYHNPHLSHQLEWGKAFMVGLWRHGIAADLFEYGQEPERDLTVFWGHRSAARRIGKKQLATGRHYLVMERGFFNDRFLHASLGFDGLNGQAEFLNHSSPSDRWSPQSHLLQPWNPEGRYYLLIGQVDGDESNAHANMRAWYQDMVEKSPYLCMFRPHPLDRSGYCPRGAALACSGLESDMANAVAVVTFSSTVGVDAMLYGKPVIAYDPISMVYDIAANDVFEELKEPDREQWAYDLAYTQWSKKEIESGEAWDHLGGMYDKV